MHSIERKIGPIVDFLTALFEHMTADGIDHAGLYLDHICFRVETEKTYKTTEKIVEKQAVLLVKSVINGRMISTYKLFEPLRFREREIWILELPAPKKGSAYADGWEHVEFVTYESLEDFIEKNKQLPFDKSGYSKLFNRDVRLKYGNISVKFHEMSLEEVINIEKENEANKFS